MINIQKASEVADYQGLKILVYGIAGAGKTSLVRTLPQDSTLLVTAESGLLSIRDLELDTVEVTGLDDLEKVFDIVEKDEKYTWIVIDSVSEVAERVLAYEMAQNKDPRKAYGNMALDMVSILKDFRDLRGVNVMFTCKQALIKDDVGPNLFKPMLPGNQLSQQLPFLMDEVFCLRVFEEKDDDGKPVLTRLFQTGPDGKYDGKDRSGALDLYEPADLSLIQDKILGKI